MFWTKRLSSIFRSPNKKGRWQISASPPIPWDIRLVATVFVPKLAFQITLLAQNDPVMHQKQDDPIEGETGSDAKEREATATDYTDD